MSKHRAAEIEIDERDIDIEMTCTGGCDEDGNLICHHPASDDDRWCLTCGEDDATPALIACRACAEWR